MRQPITKASKPTCFVIESREAGEEDGRWQEWNSHTDPAQLLRAFVNSVSSEEIDDVNRYWRVRETPVADDKQTTQPHMQDAALPVIITLNDAKASFISNPQRPVILINFDELRDTSDSSLALDLIDAITQIRQNVVREAIDRATRDCLFLFVYEYKGSLSDNTAWAALLEHEQPPKDSLLLCTVNQNGVVDWKIDDHDLTQIPTPPITLPIDQVTFDNVSSNTSTH